MGAAHNSLKYGVENKMCPYPYPHLGISTRVCPYPGYFSIRILYRAPRSSGYGYGSRTERTKVSGAGITRVIPVKYPTQEGAKKTNLISIQRMSYTPNGILHTRILHLNILRQRK